MKDATASGELQRRLTQLEQQGWKKFWEKRDTGHSVIRREAPVALDSSLSDYEDGMDPESPLLIYDRAQHMQILTMDPSKIDVIALEQGKDAEAAAEKKRMFLASLLSKMNDNGRIDGPWSQGISDAGLAVFRLHWKMLPEMPEEEATKRVSSMRGEGEDDNTYDSKKSEREAKARDTYFEDYDEDCWWVQPIGIGEICFSDLSDNPDIAIQKSVIPYIDNQIQSKLDGDKWLSLDDAKKVMWLGEPQAPADRMAQQNDANTQTLTYFVMDAKDPKTGKRTISEYVCAGDNVGEAEKVNEYDNPLGRCSFFPVASGGEVPMEKNPHHRYVPKMHAEIALIAQLNYLQKHVMALARRASMRPPFIDISKINDAAAGILRELPGWSEGAMGAQKGFVYQMPDPANNEMAILPTVTKWPDEVNDHLAMLINWTKEELAAVRPNRMATGDFMAAMEPKTATMGLAGMQASQLPYGADLTKKGAFMRQLMDAICHCIVEWDEGTPSGMQKKYYMRGTGSEPVLTGSVEAGSVVYITADDAKRPHFIRVETKNETLQEQMLNNQESRVKFERGEITWEDHLANLGVDDPISYNKKLERDKLERAREPRKMAQLQQEIEEYISILSGRDLTAMSGGPVPPTMTDGQQGQGTQPQTQSQGWGVAHGTAPVVPGASGDSVGAR